MLQNVHFPTVYEGVNARKNVFSPKVHSPKRVTLTERVTLEYGEDAALCHIYGRRLSKHILVPLGSSNMRARIWVSFPFQKRIKNGFSEYFQKEYGKDFV